MKKAITIFLALSVVWTAGAQEDDTTRIGVGKKNIVTVTESDEGTSVNVKDNAVIVDEKDDTVKVKLGNRAFSITEDNDEVNIEIIEEEDFEKHGWKKRPERFRGHWAGYAIGMNNFVDRDFNLAGATAETGFMDLNSGKSWEQNINFLQYSLPMGLHIGWVTGMGFKWNAYWFDRNNNITKDPLNDMIVPLDPPPGVVYDKSKLNTTFLTVPLLLELQFGQKGRGYFSAGVIGDLKLTSSTKIKYYENGSKQKERVKNDFNLSPLRYHLTARIGYRFIKLYATYSMVQLFRNNSGPEIYPVTVGLTLINFR